MKKQVKKPVINTKQQTQEIDFSLTQEIAEIERKRGIGEIKRSELSEEEKLQRELSLTQILNEYKGKTASGDGVQKPDLSATQVLDEHKKRSDMSVTQIISDYRIPPERGGNALQDTISSLTPLSTIDIQDIRSKTDDSNTIQDEDIKIALAQPPKPYKPVDTAEIPALAAVKVKTRQVPKPTVPTVPADISAKQLRTSVIDVVPIGKPKKPQPRQDKLEPPTAAFPALTPEEVELEMLEKELSLENPDEMLDGLNPYEIKKAARTTELTAVSEEEVANVAEIQIAETPVTPVTAKVKTATLDMDGVLVAGVVDDVDDVKEYESTFDKIKAAKPKPVSVPTPTSTKLRSYPNQDMNRVLDEYNQKFTAKRRAANSNRKTRNLDTLAGVTKVGKGRTVTGLNINYDKQIIKDTASFTAADLHAHSRQLEQAGGDKKKLSLGKFMFENPDLEEDDITDKKAQVDDEVDNEEFDSYDSGAFIANYLIDIHSGLKWRFFLLTLLTITVLVVTFINDFGGEFRQSLIAQRFNDDYESYANAFVFGNMIAAFLGVILCLNTFKEGLANLFKGRADCDTACALPTVLAAAMSVAHISSSGSSALLQQGKAHLYVAVALCGLTLNTLGKIYMIIRARKNFRFISGDNVKFSAYMPDNADAAGFLRGIDGDLPVPVFMRRTEFLTDFIKNSYSKDRADRVCRKLVPIALLVSAAIGVGAYLLPLGDRELAGNMCWAVTAAGAALTALLPFTLIFIGNNPLLKASNELAESDCAVTGAVAAEKFAMANAAVIDASVLFPHGSVRFINVKRCQKPNSIDPIMADEALRIAASLALKSGSLLSSMFYDMINGDVNQLRDYDIEECQYEINMGMLGWMKSKRVLLGNREQMRHHGVDIPAIEKERKHTPHGADVLYLAVNNETVAMIFVEVTANALVCAALDEMEMKGFMFAVKTTDSIVTAAKLTELFDIDPARVRILPQDLHKAFDEYNSYVSRANSEIACNGTFTSFARALVAAKVIVRDMAFTSALMWLSVIFAAFLVMAFTFGTAPAWLSPSAVILYNAAWLGLTLTLQGLKRY